MRVPKAMRRVEIVLSSASCDRTPTMQPTALERLIEAFRILPGVGQKTAQRMAYHVLERDRDGGQRLSDALATAVERIGHCTRCRDFSECDLCATCANTSRDAHLLCAVESPADRLVIEQATGYRGYYFVLQGRLSPLDGIGPRDRRPLNIVEQALGQVRGRSQILQALLVLDRQQIRDATRACRRRACQARHIAQAHAADIAHGAAFSR